MSNNVLLLFIIGVVVVAGGGYFLVSNTGGGGGESGDAMREEQVGTGGSGTLASLMASRQNLECTFEHRDGANVTSGTVYMTGGAERMRGDFTLEQGSAEAMEAHMIRTGGYNYVWGSFFPQGIKSKVTAENEGKLFDDDEGGIDEDTTFDCASWRVDNSKFSLPSGVEFMDISKQIEQIDSAMEEVMSQQCAACDQVPAGAAREQCLQALGC